MNSFCPDCNEKFYYDGNINSKHFETEANHIGLQLGGLFPICPNCEAKCKRESLITWENSQITVKKTWLPMDLDCLPSGLCPTCENPLPKGTAECKYCKDKVKIERLLLK